MKRKWNMKATIVHACVEKRMVVNVHELKPQKHKLSCISVKVYILCDVRAHRRQAVIVDSKHVALQSISKDGEGRLEFYVHVELEEEILTQEAIENASLVCTPS